MQMKILKIAGLTLAVVILTVVTQVGGIVFLLSLPFRILINKKTNRKAIQRLAHVLCFIMLYLIVVFLIVPIIAKPAGRIPLPMFETNHVQPVNVLTCILARNYVRPEMHAVVINVAKEMNSKYPGSVVNYLDANFPFYTGFPLFPHLSHNDGKKLDLSFYYRTKNQKQTNDVPSFIGYGVCEGPLPGEEDKPSFCKNKGYWQYGLLEHIISQKASSDFIFDAQRTRSLITELVSRQEIGKLFIEPHLKARMKLTDPKIRYHGCQAVRHDDHVHIQLK
jgi:hypothetical protein